MKYSGEFYSINQVLYKIEITTKTSGSDKELLLSGNPFVSSITSDDSHIYSPIRCGGATIGILTESYVPDFYTGELKGVSVKLTNQTTNKVEWTGYVTPSMYSQSFDKCVEEIQIDCVDGIAVLKDLQFEIEGEKITSLAQIIFNCLKKSGCYSSFYISDNVQFTQTGTESIIEKLRISQSNFFDGKKDVEQKDDDVAYYYYDVLYQICQFLGYTLIVEGDEVFIIDYDAIKSGNNKYFKYSLTTNSLSSPTSVNMSYSKFIEDSGDYSQNGSNIEMTEVFNKVTVKDEFNTYENLFPTFGDDLQETNITAPQANLSSYFNPMKQDDVGLWWGDHIAASPSDGLNDNIFICLDSDGWDTTWISVFKFKESPVFNMIKYDRNTREQVDLGKTITYGNLLDYNGAFYYKWYHSKNYGYNDNDKDGHSDEHAWMDNMKVSYNFNGTTAHKLEKWGQLFASIRFMDKLKFSTCIALINAGDNRFGPGDEKNYNSTTENDVTKNYPYITLKDDYNSSIFGGPNHYLKIKGKVCSHDKERVPHKMSDGSKNSVLRHKPDYKRISQGYIWCKLKWGNRYWKGDGWTSEETWFKLFYWDDTDRSSGDKGRGIRCEDYFDKDFEIKNTTYSLIGMGEDGLVIPCPTDGNLEGQAELSFTTRDMWGDSRKSHWHPKGTKTDNFYCRYLSRCVFISDLEITANVYEGFSGNDEIESDTIYTNVIENGAVNKMEEITFKVCTDDGKKASYSSVDYLDNGNSKYVTTLYNKALYNKERGTVGTDGEDGKLRQEEHYVFKLATQYENPMLVFNCNLRNDGNKLYGTYTDKTLSGKTFVPIEREIDYKFNKCNVRLIQKS